MVVEKEARLERIAKLTLLGLVGLIALVTALAFVFPGLRGERAQNAKPQGLTEAQGPSSLNLFTGERFPSASGKFTICCSLDLSVGGGDDAALENARGRKDALRQLIAARLQGLPDDQASEMTAPSLKAMLQDIVVGTTGLAQAELVVSDFSVVD
jgi:hypothetical protein